MITITVNNMTFKLVNDDLYYVYLKDKLCVDNNGKPITFKLEDINKILTKIVEIIK